MAPLAGPGLSAESLAKLPHVRHVAISLAPPEVITFPWHFLGDDGEPVSPRTQAAAWAVHEAELRSLYPEWAETRERGAASQGFASKQLEPLRGDTSPAEPSSQRRTAAPSVLRAPGYGHRLDRVLHVPRAKQGMTVEEARRAALRRVALKRGLERDRYVLRTSRSARHKMKRLIQRDPSVILRRQLLTVGDVAFFRRVVHAARMDRALQECGAFVTTFVADEMDLKLMQQAEAARLSDSVQWLQSVQRSDHAVLDAEHLELGDAAPRAPGPAPPAQPPSGPARGRRLLRAALCCAGFHSIRRPRAPSVERAVAREDARAPAEHAPAPPAEKPWAAVPRVDEARNRLALDQLAYASRGEPALLSTSRRSDDERDAEQQPSMLLSASLENSTGTLPSRPYADASTEWAPVLPVSPQLSGQHARGALLQKPGEHAPAGAGRSDDAQPHRSPPPAHRQLRAAAQRGAPGRLRAVSEHRAAERGGARASGLIHWSTGRTYSVSDRPASGAAAQPHSGTPRAGTAAARCDAPARSGTERSGPAPPSVSSKSTRHISVGAEVRIKRRAADGREAQVVARIVAADVLRMHHQYYFVDTLELSVPPSDAAAAAARARALALMVKWYYWPNAVASSGPPTERS